MKLIFCPKCGDMVVLAVGKGMQLCRCKTSGGYYHVDGLHATHNGKGVPLMISNPELIEQARAYLKDPTPQIERPIKCAVIPIECETLHLEKPVEENELGRVIRETLEESQAGIRFRDGDLNHELTVIKERDGGGLEISHPMLEQMDGP